MEEACRRRRRVDVEGPRVKEGVGPEGRSPCANRSQAWDWRGAPMRATPRRAGRRALIDELMRSELGPVAVDNPTQPIRGVPSATQQGGGHERFASF